MHSASFPHESCLRQVEGEEEQSSLTDVKGLCDIDADDIIAVVISYIFSAGRDDVERPAYHKGTGKRRMNDGELNGTGLQGKKKWLILSRPT